MGNSSRLQVHSRAYSKAEGGIMTTASELVKRLRDIANFDTPQDPRKGCLEAASLIESQEEQIRRFREALTKLVEINDNHGPFGGELYQDRIDRAWDAARSALQQKE
jgi:hypothetical protein